MFSPSSLVSDSWMVESKPRLWCICLSGFCFLLLLFANLFERPLLLAAFLACNYKTWIRFCSCVTQIDTLCKLYATLSGQFRWIMRSATIAACDELILWRLTQCEMRRLPRVTIEGSQKFTSNYHGKAVPSLFTRRRWNIDKSKRWRFRRLPLKENSVWWSACNDATSSVALYTQLPHMPIIRASIYQVMTASCVNQLLCHNTKPCTTPQFACRKGQT